RAGAIPRGQTEVRRAAGRAPVALAAASRDAAARSIAARLTEEILALVRVALKRLDLRGQPVEVLLGGGLLRSGDSRLIGAIEAGLKDAAPSATVHTTSSPPIVGAALLGLDELAAGSEA